MTQKFDKYWGVYNLLMSLVAVLDPRYKMKLINFCFPFIYPELEASMHIDRVLSVLHELYEVYVTTHNSSIFQQSANENASVSIVSTPHVIPKVPQVDQGIRITLEVVTLFGPLNLIWIFILKRMSTYARRMKMEKILIQNLRLWRGGNSMA
jgi:hypothetical protein